MRASFFSPANSGVHQGSFSLRSEFLGGIAASHANAWSKDVKSRATCHSFALSSRAELHAVTSTTLLKRRSPPIHLERGRVALVQDVQPLSIEKVAAIHPARIIILTAPPYSPRVNIAPQDDFADNIKTAEETKKVLKSAMDPTALQVQVSKVRKVGRAGVVVQTTSVKAADKIKKAVPPTLRVTEPRSRRPLVALRNLSGDPSGEAVMTGLFEQNLRIKHPEWPLERLVKNCRVAFKKSRHERATTTVVLECEPELRDILVSLDRAYIGWEAVTVCDYIDVTCCRKCQQYGHPEAHCRSGETVCARCGSTGHRAADCKAETTKCATCHRFGRREADSHATAARECPARKFAEERLITVTRYG
ncbi:Uncharacterized 50 kDa protein in type I retrotransposable element R1DM [Eumeta japonica]|uniref:Uncharacterized 50 kDa protein in type I retrotransposable element R1DM n=1 Tax=Eumeta variegata TaxID=151549 RepID=A0A4C1XRR6_EUMVA|nr:Uncharacterized 50 kDa protein in type I retrotransposable element R1DM [Eumeta japonica]